MSGTRENMMEMLKRKAVSAASREYSIRSSIRKAYEAGQMPIDHQRLCTRNQATIPSDIGEGTQR